MNKKRRSGPDWLQEQTALALHWLQANASAVLLVVVPILIVAVGAMGWQYTNVYLASSRRAELAEVDGMLQSVLEVTEKKRQKIQEKIDAVEVKSDEKKDSKIEVEKLTQQLEEIKPDYTAVIQSYEEYFKAHTSDIEGWRAAVEASVLLSQDREESALKHAAGLLSDVLKSSSRHEVYGFQVRMMLISIQEELKQYKEAVQNIDTALAMASKDVRANVLMVKARILRGMGQNDDAKEVLNEIISQHAEAPEAQKARAVLAL
ncbi:MAG: tol-pal system YbgF family protein [Oligoflexales bacterium]